MPRRKPASARANRETRDIGIVRLQTSGVPEVPTVAGKPMLASTRAAWVKFWESEIAGLVLDADRPALDRLFGLYDMRERMARVFARLPFVEGSTGQMVVHPAAKEMASLDARIQALEDRFGVTPAARLKLGIILGAAAKSLEDMNRDFTFDDDQEDEDPRLRTVIVG